MFSGIIESKQKIVRVANRSGVLGIAISRPTFFEDIKLGDSIAVNGVCLTVEEFDSDLILFTLGQETLNITGWNQENLLDREVNVERSLRFGDRIHGHLVSGHVDATAEVVASEMVGENLLLKISLPTELSPFCWKKGSVTVNGISLTINEVEESIVSLCIIPETQRLTNIANLKLGDKINLEADYFAKAMRHFWEQQNA